MNQNPYESPRIPLEEKAIRPFGQQAARLVILGIMALGALFVLSIIGEIVIDLMFPSEEPTREPFFPPIDVTNE